MTWKDVSVCMRLVKGETTATPSLPESFNVLVKELQSLAIDVELVESVK